MQAISEKALQHAIRRVQDFALVNRGRESWAERVEAIDTFLSSVGWDSDRQKEFNDWADTYYPEVDSGYILLGVLLGLFVLEYETES
jgi:hypothetical protein